MPSEFEFAIFHEAREVLRRRTKELMHGHLLIELVGPRPHGGVEGIIFGWYVEAVHLCNALSTQLEHIEDDKFTDERASEALQAAKDRIEQAVARMRPDVNVMPSIDLAAHAGPMSEIAEYHVIARHLAEELAALLTRLNHPAA